MRLTAIEFAIIIFTSATLIFFAVRLKLDDKTEYTNWSKDMSTELTDAVLEIRKNKVTGEYKIRFEGVKDARDNE